MTLEIDCPACARDFWIQLEPTRVRTSRARPFALPAACPHCRAGCTVELAIKGGRRRRR